jgi:hypothetical protein
MCFIVPPPLPPPVSYAVVRGVASLLPLMTNVAHDILAADKEFIHWVVNSGMTDQAKSFVILLSIQIAQMADHIGSHVMDMYVDAMKYLLQ